MQTSHGKAMARLFWSINDRNPLSPYWFALARPLILRHPNGGWYLIRHGMDLFCAVSVFLLVHRLGRGRHALFAFSCALLTLFWNVSKFKEDGHWHQCIWDRIGVLAVAALCLWAYCKYVDGGRRRGAYLGVSLILYLLAVGTYSLQGSCCLAVLVLGTFRSPDPADSFRAWARRVGRAVFDLGLYLAVFALFVGVWTTAGRPAMSVHYVQSRSLIAEQLPASLRQMLWYDGYTRLVHDIAANWSLGGIALVLLGSVPLFFWLLRKLTTAEASREPQVTLERPEDTAAPSVLPAAVYTIAISLALVAMTVAVESTSRTWYPGSRTLMAQQVFHPLLYCGLFFGATALFRPWFPTGTTRLQVAGVALAAGAVFLAGLEYNRELRAATSRDVQFLTKLRDKLPATATPSNIIMKVDGVDFASWGTCTHRYIQTYYNDPSINLQFLAPGDPIDHWDGYNTMLFCGDADGVWMMGAAEGLRLIPYREVLFARYDGHEVTFLETVTRDDLRGYRVGFLRDGPIHCQHPAVAGKVVSPPAAAPVSQTTATGRNENVGP
jgi:hypothetical protein